MLGTGPFRCLELTHHAKPNASNTLCSRNEIYEYVRRCETRGVDCQVAAALIGGRGRWYGACLLLLAYQRLIGGSFLCQNLSMAERGCQGAQCRRDRHFLGGEADKPPPESPPNPRGQGKITMSYAQIFVLCSRCMSAAISTPALPANVCTRTRTPSVCVRPFLLQHHALSSLGLGQGGLCKPYATRRRVCQ